MYFIGDVHGKFQDYFNIIKKYKSSIQIGDMGVGLNQDQDNFFESWSDHLGINNKFIRGNHDSPESCRRQNNYLGDYGYLEDQDLFYIGGAWSIDRLGRTEHVDWWRDEELSCSQWKKVHELYCQIKPRFVVSHDAPLSVYNKVANVTPVVKNLTAENLDLLFNYSKPEEWIFGHHHKDREFEYDKTKFVCIDELNVYENKNIKDF